MNNLEKIINEAWDKKDQINKILTNQLLMQLMKLLKNWIMVQLELQKK